MWDGVSEDLDDVVGPEWAAAIRARLAVESDARSRLLRRFGNEHERCRPERTSAHDLVRHVLGAAPPPQPTAEDWIDALRMIKRSHADLDTMECQVITQARAAGLTWRQVAAALGLDSARAAQHRLTHLGGRE
ncbi:hypothetical protein [Nonomuraea endophytica]|uniref:Uncharacterized protein n=1 Tax=Nonomuraea endophytica TaxID=714136 RepID=A0A7W8AD68_9ACTN|nr:hypothetical protein [Nonomuraea endophytica]MBB5084007.1 hypothetical protein [Nonomuraea endophytica]